jgi:hypothetical protein
MKLGMAVHTCNPSRPEAEAARLCSRILTQTTRAFWADL